MMCCMKAIQKYFIETIIYLNFYNIGMLEPTAFPVRGWNLYHQHPDASAIVSVYHILPIKDFLDLV